MGDDGYVNVPLQFSFPFYGQSFNDSWMYDNGIVSFKQPGTSGAISPYQWSATPLSNVNGSYFIAPLWADIAPKQGTTTYIVQGDSTYQKYTWTNIGEFYSLNGGVTPRLNTFSLTIKSDGSYNASYGNIYLTTSNVTVGSVGNPSAGEINQIFNVPYGTQVLTGSISDWSVGASSVVDPCKTNILSSPTCPGYYEAISKISSVPVTPIIQTPTTVSNDSTVIEPIVSTVSVLPTTVTNTSTTNTVLTTETTTPVVTPTTQSVTSIVSATPSVNNPQPKVGDVQPAGSANKPVLSLSTILGIIGAEQTRIGDVERSVVSSSIEQSWFSTSQTIKESELISSSLTQQSISSSIQMASLGSLNISNNTNTETQSLLQSSLSSTTKTETKSVEQINTEQLTQQEEQDKKEQKQDNKKVQDNELSSGGVTLSSLAVTPKGYELYSFIMPDNSFYDTKDIYRKQRIIDNVKAMRLLNLSSDSKHKEMIELQYKGNYYDK